MHFHAAQARGNRLYHHIPSIRYINPLSLIWRETPTLISHRPSSLLAHNLSGITVKRLSVPGAQSVKDYSARCDALFLDHIHLASRARVYTTIREGKICHIALFLFSLSETIIAFNPTAPCHVSHTRTYLLRLFTRSFSTEQCKCCVSLNPFAPNVIWSEPLLGIFQ